MSTNFPTALDTLTNPTATDYLNSPSHAGQHSDANDAIEALEAKVGVDSSAVTTSHDYKLAHLYAIASTLNPPRGYLINGKIVVSISTNNLTVAIKGLDGNDPSATNPVYCRIGDTPRAITAALSVTKNAGTNWFNSGSTYLATIELDYFVYLGYNATDGVVIGFARTPAGKEYDDFSATSTNEKYCAISTITNAAAGDDYENIGRFAATLSAGAGYTWSVPTFTNKNLIQRPINETRWIFDGRYRFKIVGDKMIVVGNDVTGTSWTQDAVVACYYTDKAIVFPFAFTNLYTINCQGIAGGPSVGATGFVTGNTTSGFTYRAIATNNFNPNAANSFFFQAVGSF